MKKTTLLALVVPAILAAAAYFPIENKKKTVHTEAERAFFSQHLGYFYPEAGRSAAGHGPDLIPIDSTILFPTGKVCGGCHGYDPNGHALVTTSGVDVNIYDDWRSTMMALSAKDPFWRAKVTHESLVNPAHALELQNKCTSCHAPAGHYQNKFKHLQPYYTLADLYADTLGLDGVTCQACHAQSPASAIGTQHSGELMFDTNNIRIAYGPYDQIFAPPMHEFVGITPKYSEHISDAGVCAGCHTLITHSADLAGQPTGTTFIEQATYHEWLNSDYDEDHLSISCQGCHVPQLNDEIIISANYQFLTPQWPYGEHTLAGANVAMLRLMKENRAALDINASAANFDSTIANTLRMLREKSIDLTLATAALSGDTVGFDVRLVNRAGHKFPSGYPSRRAWVEFEVRNAAGNLVFHSGAMAPDYSLPDEDPNFEPHHNVIDDPAEVQIYEIVAGDVTGAFTNVLERAHTALKDNRLTPKGFLMSDAAYDTTQIVGHALLDADFNRNATGVPGSGSDVVHYRLPTNGYSGLLQVKVRVWYQSLPPRWMAPLFEYSSPEIDSFKTMYYATDASEPVLVAERVLDSVYVSSVKTKSPALADAVAVTPTLTADGRVTITTANGIVLRAVRVYDSAGRLVWDRAGDTVWLPPTAGVYLVAVETNRGRVVKKVVRSH
jgi:hypothetical protein